jgi:DNA replication licensing factor MCM4
MFSNLPHQAHARVRFSPTVEPQDVAEAMRLVQTALRQTATDPRTGVIDMDVITTGTTRAARSLLGALVRNLFF